MAAEKTAFDHICEAIRRESRRRARARIEQLEEFLVNGFPPLKPRRGDTIRFVVIPRCY